MICNIDAKGKRTRLIAGIVFSIVGLLMLALWAIPSATATAWTITLLVLCCAAFMIFEARAGWCALRALGFRTRV